MASLTKLIPKTHTGGHAQHMDTDTTNASTFESNRSMKIDCFVGISLKAAGKKSCTCMNQCNHSIETRTASVGVFEMLHAINERRYIRLINDLNFNNATFLLGRIDIFHQEKYRFQS